MVKELQIISILDDRTNKVKLELLQSGLTKEELVQLMSDACNDVIEAVCRLYEIAED